MDIDTKDMDAELKLKKTLLEIFPKLMKDLDACKTHEEMRKVQKEHLLNYVNDLNMKLGKEPMSADELTVSDLTASVTIEPATYDRLMKARGNDIKNRLHVIIDGLARLKGMEKNDAGMITAQIVFSGCLSIGKIATSATIRSLLAGAGEAVAALAGVEAASVGVVCAIAAVVIVAVIIPFLYFMLKPANGILLLINELDEEIEFVEDYNVHGKETLITSPIPRGLVLLDRHYVAGGLIASEKDKDALFGTQYGVTYKYKNIKFQFAFEVPLTGIHVHNNCYCGVGMTARDAAYQTNRHNAQSYHVEGSGIKVDIKVNSGSGSIAYYIGRVYK